MICTYVCICMHASLSTCTVVLDSRDHYENTQKPN